MTEPDGRTTPRVRALLNRRRGGQTEATGGAGAPPRVIADVERVTVDDHGDDLPGTAYARPAGSVSGADDRTPVEQQATEAGRVEPTQVLTARDDAEPTAVLARGDDDDAELTEVVSDERDQRDAATTTTVISAPTVAPLYREAGQRRVDEQVDRVGRVETDEDVEATSVIEEPKVEATSVIPVDRNRDAEREERAKRLGIVAAPAPAAEPVVPVAKARRTTDKWFGSLPMLLLRLVTAAMLGAQAWAHLAHWTQTRAFFSHSVLPQPEYFAIGVVAAEILAAVLLVLGLATRFAGVLVLAVQVLLLVFFVYGTAGPVFTPGENGFKGDREILLGTIGLLFLMLGAGGIAIDRVVRRNRARAREERLLGNTV